MCQPLLSKHLTKQVWGYQMYLPAVSFGFNTNMTLLYSKSKME